MGLRGGAREMAAAAAIAAAAEQKDLGWLRVGKVAKKPKLVSVGWAQLNSSLPPYKWLEFPCDRAEAYAGSLLLLRWLLLCVAWCLSPVTTGRPPPAVLTMRGAQVGWGGSGRQADCQGGRLVLG